jgi:phosphoserine aminotransferase
MNANTPKPHMRPADPRFSSGPTKKRPNWSLDALSGAVLGRSHRSKPGKARLKLAIDLTREVLQVPDGYRIGIVAGSDTGAVEMAMWSMLGPKPVATLAWESFGEDWVTDAVKQLKLDPVVIKADYGHLPDLAAVPAKTHDVIFTWNGTTSGTRVPNADWIPADREGITICDATSAAFAQALDWDKLDVVTFSWQKVLGGEGAHGMLILGPRAVARLESYTPAWPMPKLFRMTKGGKLVEGIFEGETINTPSMLATEDYIDALTWAKSVGGLVGLHGRADANLGAIAEWVEKTAWVDFLAATPESRVTGLSEEGQANFAKKLAGLLDKEGVALDAAAYRAAPPGLRLWCGATIDTDDVIALTPWLDWAFETLVADL